MSLSRRYLVKAGLCAALVLPHIAFAQAVKWHPGLRFPGTFFPSYALSASGMDAKGLTNTPTAYGYLNSSEFAVTVTEAPPGAKLKVQIEVPELDAKGEIEASGLTDGKPKAIAPRVSWSQSKLVALEQPMSAEVVFRVYADGMLVSEERRPLRIRAIDDAPLLSCQAPGKCADLSPFMAAYVNENHPAIDGILRAALDIPAMPVKRWTGTQGSEDEVMRQVWAIWYLFQRNRVTYSSITTVSDERADLQSQTIRPLSHTLKTAQANCIDGAALFASILRKIGIEPTIVLIPGHAFLGFALDSNGSRMAYLETTMLNDQNNPFKDRGPSKAGSDLAKMLGTDVHRDKSWSSFVEAINVGRQRFTQAAPNFGKLPGYRLVSVRKARQMGILPLPL